ncbi:uncharacterized protein N7446_005548 [Penicillium canescens]|uniref:uncharacterized protein n=1 Tax=Penicillium canescens TaxID=5083 RepID=UPI0026E002D5|nr:uncharacterized protein N7446_005548 [Penicillium canescens]KAJ6050216.1 hypothetical protein N7444_006932 [Penicillium canescens]KAJ6061428.1 hypothetical protein N7446_005548 [Penicillium canescens]
MAPNLKTPHLEHIHHMIQNGLCRRLLASGSLDKTLRFWDTATGSLQQTLMGHSGSVHSVAFSPDGRLLASGSGDNTVRLWDPVTDAPHQALEGHSGWVRSVAFSPDGRLLASGSYDYTVRLWDTATGGLQQILEGHSESVHSVAFLPDGRLLASGSNDKTVRLWDSATGALHQAWSLKGLTTTLTFSTDGSYLKTDLGSLHVQSRGDNHTPGPPYVNLAIYIEQGKWIILNGEKVLWLPAESRSTCSATNGTVAASLLPRKNAVVIAQLSSVLSQS